MTDTIRNTLAENLGGPAQKLATHKFTLEEVPDLSGKTAVVTGGSQGVGYGCTHTLLSHNIEKIFIISTTETVADDAIAAIREELGPDAAAKVVYMPADLSDWKSLKAVADDISEKAGDGGIDILINNAAKGIMTAQQTPDGVDTHMAINHFGHVLLTSYLLPSLKRAAANHPDEKVRIVTTSSNLHASGKPEAFDSLAAMNKDYGANGQYGNAKLANLLYARYLARHLTPAQPTILSTAVHPGIVDTKQTNKDIHEPFPLLGYGMSVLAAPFKKTQFEGCHSAMFAATKVEQSGLFICSPAVPEDGSEPSRDDALGERLMELTRSVLQDKGIDPPAFY